MLLLCFSPEKVVILGIAVPFQVSSFSEQGRSKEQWTRKCAKKTWAQYIHQTKAGILETGSVFPCLSNLDLCRTFPESARIPPNLFSIPENARDILRDEQVDSEVLMRPGRENTAWRRLDSGVWG